MRTMRTTTLIQSVSSSPGRLEAKQSQRLARHDSSPIQIDQILDEDISNAKTEKEVYHKFQYLKCVVPKTFWLNF